LYDAFRNRVIFPICDDLGNPIAFGARKINPEDEPKYLNSAESAIFNKSRTLYGLNLAKRAIIDAKLAIITEGYTDVIACHQAGVCNVVATLGTALTGDHAKVLSKLCDRIVLLFDGDEAGQKAGDRGFDVFALHYGLEAFFNEKVDISVCVLPDDLDPDEMLKQSNGLSRFNQSIENSVGILEFVLNRFRNQLDRTQGISGRQKALEAFLSHLGELGLASIQGVRRSLILTQLSDLLAISIAEIDAALPKRRAAAQRATESDEQIEIETKPTVDLSPARSRAERDLLSILIYQPELHAEPVSCDQGEALLCNLIQSDAFADPLTRILADAILPRLQRSESFTVQQLLASIQHDEARALASSLYFDGQRLCDPPTTGTNGITGVDHAVHIYRSAAASLQSYISLEHYHQSVTSYRQCRDAPDQALLAAQAVIEQRRRQGNIASAIPRGVRS
jgi:DNA primase